MSSKSSAVNPVIGDALLVGDDDAEVNEIDAGAERLLRGEGGAVSAAKSDDNWLRAWRSPRAATRLSEHLVTRDADDVRPAPAVRIHALEPVPPLRRDQRPERRRRLDRCADTRESAHAAAQSRGRGRTRCRRSRRDATAAPATTRATNAVPRRRDHSGSAPTDNREADCRTCRTQYRLNRSRSCPPISATSPRARRSAEKR